MSTTVSYKGSTLTTVNNQTRTLHTAGKWLEGNIVLADISQNTVTSANHIVSGHIGHLADGTQVTGTFIPEVNNLKVDGAIVEGTSVVFNRNEG